MTVNNRLGLGKLKGEVCVTETYCTECDARDSGCSCVSAKTRNDLCFRVRPQFREIFLADPQLLVDVITHSDTVLNDIRQSKYPRDICSARAARELYTQYPRKAITQLGNNGHAFLVLGGVSDHLSPPATVGQKHVWTQWLKTLNQPERARIRRSVLVKVSEPAAHYTNIGTHLEFFAKELNSLHESGITFTEIPYGDQVFRHFHLHVIFLGYTGDLPELGSVFNIKTTQGTCYSQTSHK